MTETHGTVSSPVLIRGIHHYDDIQLESKTFYDL
ncbi:BnaA02g17940D [Brassica napus]|uniref:BnaA02g17940D protein n=1 Tax=Brassica napus TaxID=3708 RepID=A0A078I7A8_BRANA|nr:BnaA02g17940D [Brassica napus]